MRAAAAAPGDFQALGRVILAFAMKMAALLAVMAVALLAGWVVYGLSRKQFLGAAVFGGVVVLADACAVLLVGRAFARFDVSRPAVE